MPLPPNGSLEAAQNATLSLASIVESIDNGDAIVILDRNVLKLNSWLRHHPGGDKAILHLVGRDATDEINSFHSKQTRRSMLRYRIGILGEQWVNVTPPLHQANAERNILEFDRKFNGVDSEENKFNQSMNLPADTLRRRSAEKLSDGFVESQVVTPYPPSIQIFGESGSVAAVKSPHQTQLTQSEVVTSFRNLVGEMENEGLYKCDYSAYLPDVIRICIIFFVMLFFLHHGWYIIAAISMGTLWHQLVFIAHDAGHMGITHNYHIDTLIGMTVGNYLGGLSMCWWKNNHNVHHLATNSPSHDPDIQHLPFLAITPSFFTSLYSTYYDRIMPYTPFAQGMMKYQPWMYYPILCFGRFNLYFLSWEFLLKDLGPRSHRWHRYYEITGQLFFWTWFGYYILYLSIPDWSSRILFLLISHAVTMPLHVQFTLSHFAMSTQPRGISEPWVRQQLRTTMDVECPEWMDWFHGGLQFQTIHHLFPRMPKHNLRTASKRVQAWCAEVGERYEIYGFVECNGRVLGRLEEVARLARTMRECQKVIVEKGDYLRGDWE